MRKSETRRILVVALVLLLAALACSAGGETEPEESDIPTPTVIPPTAAPAQPGVDVMAFKQELINALSAYNRDYAQLQSYMGNEFWITDDYSAMNYIPTDAVQALRDYPLSPEYTISADINLDPTTMFDLPEADDYIYSTGWGDGTCPGILMINKVEDGSYYWHGVAIFYLACDSASDTTAAQPTAAPPAVEDHYSQFMEGLAASLNAPHDFNLMSTYMGDTFDIYFWNEGTSEQYSRDDMIYMLRDRFIPFDQGLGIRVADFYALLGDSPYTLYPYAYEFMYTVGWGPNSSDEAILMISQATNGTYYWSGMLYGTGGFNNSQPASANNSSGTWVPLSGNMCADIQSDVNAELGVTITSLTNPIAFTDWVNGGSGQGCQVIMNASGAEGIDFYMAYDRVGIMLERIGWTRDAAYDADNPTGFSSGYRRDSGLILLVVSWQPSPFVDCPDDQPLSACNIDEANKLYTLEMLMAMK